MLALASSMRPEGSAPHYNILVVDDEADIRDAVQGLLEFGLPGAHVITAASGDEALDILRHATVDLIVSDYKMPGMNGLQFLKRASLLQPKAPRILITAFERELAEAIAREGAVARVFTKPLSPRPLLAACDKMLHGV